MKSEINQPIFQSVFQDHWNSLPPVFKKHYQNKPFCSELVEAQGYLEVQSRWPLLLLRPFYRLLGIAPIVNEKKIPALIYYRSGAHSAGLSLERVFLFQNKAPYHFCSTLYPGKGGEVMDVMSFGLTWRIQYEWRNNRVILSHRGYALSVFGKIVPIPLTFLLGRIDAYEYAIDDEHFGMKAQITHRLFGILYSYAGEFRIVSQ